MKLLGAQFSIPVEAFIPEENQIGLFPEQDKFEVTQKGKIYLKRKKDYVKISKGKRKEVIQCRFIPSK